MFQTPRSGVSRRDFLAMMGVGVAAGAATAVLGGCSSSSQGKSAAAQGASQSKNLDMNSFGGSFTIAQNSAVNTPFARQYGANIHTVVDSPIDVYTQLKQGHGQAQMDFALADQPFADQVISAGYARTLGAGNMPNLDLLPTWAKDTNGKWAATFYNLIGIAYNPNKVKNPPKSWAELWSKEYAGHVALCTADHTAGFLFLIEAARLNGGSEKNIEPGFAALKRMKPNIGAFWQTATQLGQLLTSSGDIWLGPYYMDQTISLKAKGAPVDFVLPSEGGLTDLGSALIPSGSSNPSFAETYFNYFLSTETQTRFAEAATLLPTNSKASIPAKALALANEHDIRNPVVPDETYVAAQLDSWVSRFSSEIQG